MNFYLKNYSKTICLWVSTTLMDEYTDSQLLTCGFGGTIYLWHGVRFGEMLDKAPSVQFNQGAEKKLALAGVKGKPTTAHKKLAFAFQTPSDGSTEEYIYPDSFSELQTQQKTAHQKGILLVLFSWSGNCCGLPEEGQCMGDAIQVQHTHRNERSGRRWHA